MASILTTSWSTRKQHLKCRPGLEIREFKLHIRLRPRLPEAAPQEQRHRIVWFGRRTHHLPQGKQRSRVLWIALEILAKRLVGLGKSPGSEISRSERFAGRIEPIRRFIVAESVLRRDGLFPCPNCAVKLFAGSGEPGFQDEIGDQKDR